jgi:hypothetical protein
MTMVGSTGGTYDGTFTVTAVDTQWQVRFAFVVGSGTASGNMTAQKFSKPSMLVSLLEWASDPGPAPRAWNGRFHWGVGSNLNSSGRITCPEKTVKDRRWNPAV